MFLNFKKPRDNLETIFFFAWPQAISLKYNRCHGNDDVDNGDCDGNGDDDPDGDCDGNGNDDGDNKTQIFL